MAPLTTPGNLGGLEGVSWTTKHDSGYTSTLPSYRPLQQNMLLGAWGQPAQGLLGAQEGRQ